MACLAWLVSKQKAELVGGDNRSEIRHSCQAQGWACQWAQQHKPPLPPAPTGDQKSEVLPLLLTCPALESLKSLQLHRHHHAIKAAEVRGGHHTPEEGRDVG